MKPFVMFTNLIYQNIPYWCIKVVNMDICYENCTYILLTHDTVSLMEIENGNKSPRAFELNAFYSFQRSMENCVKQVTIWYQAKTAICHS